MRFFLVSIVSFFISTSLSAGVITIGTSSYDPPFEMIANKTGDFVGFEVDLMNAICKRLNETCHYKALTFEQILSETQAGSIDLAISGISITLDRQKVYLFSLPYLVSDAQLLANSDVSINTLNDIAGKRIGVEAGTVFRALATEQFKNTTIVEYTTQNDLFQALANKNVDLIVLDKFSAQYWVDNNQGLFKTVEKSIPVGVGYGIMANKSQTALISRINQVLIAMENDGTYLTLYQRYF